MEQDYEKPVGIFSLGGRMEEYLKLETKVRLTAYYKGTKRVFKVIETHNVICAEGKELVGGFLIDTSGVYDVGLTYMEIGSGATTPTSADDTLTTYEARKLITTRTRALNVVTFSTFWVAADCTYDIKEAGIWGGSNAGGAEASGLLFSHWLNTFDNTGGDYDITFDYVLTIGA